ncbi:hypothetical protein CLIM01_14120 [Colletotrichum limetticola]|uniref:Uncharacterized protein n=1 Tax=Colletotrichum limetticola TaxID=1209924 RepID=A0ABQ9PF29_9PEZI|nr:hypothetical protein CLIM01_14120 [Colletotrichum limetticola]
MSRQQVNSPAAESMDASQHQPNSLDTISSSYPSPFPETPHYVQHATFSLSHQMSTPSQPQTSAASYEMYESSPSGPPTPPNTPRSQDDTQQQQLHGHHHQMTQFPPLTQAYGTQSMQPQITMALSRPQPIALASASGAHGRFSCRHWTNTYFHVKDLKRHLPLRE